MPVYRHKRPRGFAPWKPKPASLAIVQTVLQILIDEQEYLPLTNRQVFYRLVAQYAYRKSEQAYANLCEKINRGRRCGMMPWAAIRDDGTTLRRHPGPYTPAGFERMMADKARRFQLDPAFVMPCFVELHVEAAGMIPQVARIANPLGADCYSAGGFGSVTFQYDTARRIAQRQVPTVILSVGDFDPSGLALYQSFVENVQAFFEQGTVPLSSHEWKGQGNCRLGITVDEDVVEPPLFRRIAVTPEQIREHGFPTAPRKQNDKRGDWRGGTVQAEAIPPAMLAEIVRDSILEHYDIETIEAVNAASDRMKPEIVAAYESVDLSAPDDDYDGIADDLVAGLHDWDWTGGYEHEDLEDKEEGV